MTAADWKWRSKSLEGSGWQIRRGNLEGLWDVATTVKTDCQVLGCQEKLLALIKQVTVSETDTGGKVEYTKARERNLVKELGTLAP